MKLRISVKTVADRLYLWSYHWQNYLSHWQSWESLWSSYTRWNGFLKPSFQPLALATTMPSTQSSLSAEKVDVVNKQPPPAPDMSTDPNSPGQRAMRLRGGCVVRLTPKYCSKIPITYTFSLGMLDTLWVLRIIVLLLRRRALMQPAMRLRGVFPQPCVFILQFQLLTTTYSRASSSIPCCPDSTRIVICNL